MGIKLIKVGEGVNFELFSDKAGGKPTVIKLKNVRVSFPAIGTPTDLEDDEGQKTGEQAWQATSMLTKDKHEAARAAARKMIDALLLENGTDAPGGGKKALKMPPEYICMKDGDNLTRIEYEGHWILASNEKKIQPTARTREGDLIRSDAEADKLFYGGCTANVMVRFWFFNGKAKGKTKEYPKRICSGLVGIQFMKKTEPFGQGRIDDEDSWGNEGSEEDDDGLGSDSSSGSDDDDI